MISILTKYIKKHASQTIINRAHSIYLELQSQIENHYIFSYQGSQRKPYKITVKTKLDPATNCSCPYNQGGLCKHEVAALNYIIDNIPEATPTIDLFGNVVSPKKHNELYLENHNLSQTIIHSIRQTLNIHYLQVYDIEITALNEGLIKTSFHVWPTYYQQFKYDQETNILTTSCSCPHGKTRQCLHTASALNSILETHGETIFNPNYLNLKKEAFLKEYGLKPTDDYKQYFEFSLEVNGLQVNKKVKHLAPTHTIATNNLIPKFNKTQENSLLFPIKSSPTQSQYGFGYCLNYYKTKKTYYLTLFPFTAKHKKHSKEFTSSFKAITPDSLIEELKNIPDLEQKTILQALEFDQQSEQSFNGFSVEYYRESFILFNALIDSIKNKPLFLKKFQDNLTKKNITEISISNDTPILSFTFSEKEHLYTLKPSITIEGKKYQINASKIKIFPFFCLFNNTVYRFKTPYEFIYINRLKLRSEINFIKQEYDNLYKTLLKPLSEHFEVVNKVSKFSKKKIQEEQLKKQVYLSDYEGEFVTFKLAVKYQEKTIFLHTKEQLFNEKTQTISKRNNSFENDFLEAFKALHPDFQEQEEVFSLTPFQLVENQWLLQASKTMEREGISIFGAKDLKSFKFNLNQPSVAMSVKSATDWFDLTLDIKYGDQNVSLKDIKKAILNKNDYVLLGDGTLGLLPKKWLEKFIKYFKAGEVQNKGIKISNYQFNIIDELYEDIENTPQFLLELQQKQQQLLHLKEVADITIPKQLKATLRPYQKEGLNWLVFLEKNNLGGCLADDMGLGKTLQVIAFLAYLKKTKKETKPHLVIVPTSLIFNWKNEISKFCPTLKTLIYTGIKRKEKIKSFSKTDLIITTYGSVLNDIETLQEIDFNYIILDESQSIKNPNSKRYKAVRMLKSNNRLALTGTPIENNTFDLYAQMNFLNPGLLGTMSHFKKEFSHAIDNMQDEEASVLLSKMIHPFLLRRTKKQVATDLPEKTESILYCEMGPEQRKVYTIFKDKYRDYLLNKIDENGVEKSQIYVLEGLTKLRQICNSPQLLKEKEDYGKSSIKLDILIDNIKTKTAKHKLLVFSQFTSMLDLIKERLEDENVAYEYLDGKTRNREAKVANFQETEDLRVFLISLKAGGVGLNLTAADYVFLVDPWWNPAIESQAIDRSYRIGQTKRVMAYKMICKDTIEEKIIALQQNKKNVSDAVVQTDKMKKSFNKSEIKDLFS